MYFIFDQAHFITSCLIVLATTTIRIRQGYVTTILQSQCSTLCFSKYEKFIIKWNNTKSSMRNRFVCVCVIIINFLIKEMGHLCLVFHSFVGGMFWGCHINPIKIMETNPHGPNTEFIILFLQISTIKAKQLCFLQ